MARPGCAPRASTAQRPAMRGGRGGSFWGRGPGSFARCLPRLCLRRARRPDGRHFARRSRLGRWRLPLAGREEGGGRREAVAAGGRGGRRVAARGQASTRVDAPGWGGLDGELGFRSRLGLRARLGGPPQARGGLARLLGRGCFSVSLPLGSLWPRATGPIRAPTPPEPAEASSAARTDPGPRRPYLAPKRSLRDERKGRRGPLFPLWV